MNMKKEWVRPTITGQEFVANEYVSACWYGKCNLNGQVYIDVNGNKQYDAGTDTFKYTNKACKKPFSIQGVDNGYNQASDFINAFVVGEQTKWVQTGSHIWQGKWETTTTVTPVYNFNNYHVSTIDAIQRATDRPNHS